MSQIVSFSGGGWAGDWFEHYQRACFFLTPLPLDTTFLDSYLLPARPPLANLLTGGIIATLPGRFAGYQVVTLVFSTLIVFPLVLFVHRWSRQPKTSVAVLSMLLMLNPMMVQNITFPWTKLFTGFWVLVGWYFMLRGSMPSGGARLRAVAWAALALGMVSHYSAGPWVVVITASYAIWWLQQHPRPAFGRELVTISAIVGLGLGTWLLWSVSHFGWNGTVGATTTVSAWDRESPWEHALAVWRNITNTMVPFPFRSFDQAMINQPSTLGYVRDVCFSIYQVNLPGGFGLAGATAAIFCLRKGSIKERFPSPRSYWWVSSFAVITLGIAVHTPPDNWGLAHICLAPLVALGIAALASCLPFSRRATAVVLAVALLDGVLGIALHHGIEAWWFPSWWAGDGTAQEVGNALTAIAHQNLRIKTSFGLRFLGDLLPVHPALALATLGAIGSSAGAHWWRIQRKVTP